VWRRKAEVTIERQRASVTADGWQPPDRFVVRGRLPPGEFEFERPTWGRPGDEHRQGHSAFESVTASGTRFQLDGTAWSASGSHFEECEFRQTLGPIGIHTEAEGSFGLGERCVYTDCLFDHVDFGQRGGGFASDDARFERCTFRFCRWRWFNEFARNDFTKAKLRGVEFRAGVDLTDSRLPASGS